MGREQISHDGCSGSLTPRFVNNDYGTAEIIYNTAHACHRVYGTAEITYSMPMRVMRYSLAHELLCAAGVCERHL